MQYELMKDVGPYILWVVPLLVENELQNHANRVLVIDVSIETQRTRSMDRDGISLQQVQSILSAQATRAQRLSIADDIIDNNGSALEIEKSVYVLHQCYLNLAAAVPRRN